MIQDVRLVWGELPEMDQYSFAELTELYFIRESGIDIQFQFWLTITFATVVATFVAGNNRLGRRLRWVAAVLYLLATVVLVTRGYYLALDAIVFRDVLIESGIPLNIPTLTIIFRVLLIGFGSFAALWLLLGKEFQRE